MNYFDYDLDTKSLPKFAPKKQTVSTRAPASGMIRVTVEARIPATGEVVTNVFSASKNNVSDVGRNAQYLANTMADAMEAPGPPAWQSGDVLLFRFDPKGKAYTYVIESVEPFKTSGTRTLTEPMLNYGWNTHRAQLMLRDGVPVEQSESCVEGDACTIDHSGMG